MKQIEHYTDLVLHCDNEVTIKELSIIIHYKFDVEMSNPCIHRMIKRLGWKSAKVKYAQTVRDANKLPRLEFAVNAIATNEQFQ